MFALTLSASGCGSSADSTPAEAGPAPPADMLTYPVDEPGPFHVGYRSWKLTYQPDAPGGPRTVLLNVWYPTLDTTGTGAVYMFAFPDADSFVDASLAPPARPDGYPVHVYSHGHSGFGGTSSHLMKYFASHGWIAIAPDHTGNTLPDNGNDREVSIYYLRSMDISAALDALETLPSSDPLAGKALTDHVVMSGHSFGTFTTWASGGAKFDMAEVKIKCESGELAKPCTPEDIAVFERGLGDPRVVAGLPMAGGVGTEPDWFGMTGYDAAKKPFMLMSGSADPVGAENVWARVTSLDFTWLDFAGGCHQLFALGGCPEFPEQEGWAAVNTYALAFARRHVLGDTNEQVAHILDGTEVVSPKVTFQHK